MRVGRWVGAALGLSLMLATSATAAPLPTLFAGGRCDAGCHTVVPVYAIRPHSVSCQEVWGGELKLSWSSWRTNRAVGAGTSTEIFMGHVERTHVLVVASLPRNGHFTRLQITFGTNPHPATLEVVPKHGTPELWGKNNF